MNRLLKNKTLRAGLLIGIASIVLQNGPLWLINIASIHIITINPQEISRIDTVTSLHAGKYWVYSPFSANRCTVLRKDGANEPDDIKGAAATLNQLIVPAGNHDDSEQTQPIRVQCNLSRESLKAAGEVVERVYILPHWCGSLLARADYIAHRVLGLLFGLFLVLYLLLERVVTRRQDDSYAVFFIFALTATLYQLYFTGIIGHFGIQAILRIALSLALTKIFEKFSTKYTWSTLAHVGFAAYLFWMNGASLSRTASLVPGYTEVLVVIILTNYLSIALYFKHPIRSTPSGKFVSYIALSWALLQGVALVQLALQYRAVITPTFTAIVCCCLIVSRFKDRLRDEAQYAKKLEAVERLKFIATNARLVAHDIRSPLSALKIIKSDLMEANPSLGAIFNAAVDRIENIANSLRNEGATGAQVNNAQSNRKEKNHELPIVLIDEVVLEKTIFLKAKYPRLSMTFDYSAEALQCLTKIDASDFKRVVSNLLNNAAEACEKEPVSAIKIVAMYQSSKLAIVIADSGVGIPENIMPFLFNSGATFGKADGSGLGLSAAKQAVESWGGTIEIASTVSKGTTVTFTIPVVDRSPSLTNQLGVSGEGTVWIVDDDPSIAELIQRRFDELKISNTLRIFDKPEQAVQCLKAGEVAPSLILTDYQFKDREETGLDYLPTFKMYAPTVLLTTYYNEPNVLKKAQTVQALLFPKPLIARWTPS